MTDLRVLATFPHYVDHMMPIVDVLRDHGVDVEVFSTRHESIWGQYIHPTDIERMGQNLWMVASSVDSGRCVGQRLVYLEHGTGQTYPGDTGGLNNPGYSDGPMNGAVLFLCPNLFVMNRRQQNHPNVPAYLVGCPKMDQYYGKATGFHIGVQNDVVALAFHWNCGICAESKSAFDHYRGGFNRLVLSMRRRGVTVVGHSHPRMSKRCQYHYERHGIEWWDHDRVLYEAAVLCVDNSSLGYEFASLDRPVVWLNSPQYRRHVHHGLRFWEYVPGVQCDGPDDLDEAIVGVMVQDTMAEWRAHVSDLVYPLRDGHSALRAAMAIETLL